MESIEKLLSKLKQSLRQDTLFRETVRGCVKEVLGFEIETNGIKISGDSLRIQTTPTKRSEIHLNEPRLLGAIRRRTGLNLKRIVY